MAVPPTASSVLVATATLLPLLAIFLQFATRFYEDDDRRETVKVIDFIGIAIIGVAAAGYLAANSIPVGATDIGVRLSTLVLQVALGAFALAAYWFIIDIRSDVTQTTIPDASQGAGNGDQ